MRRTRAPIADSRHLVVCWQGFASDAPQRNVTVARGTELPPDDPRVALSPGSFIPATVARADWPRDREEWLVRFGRTGSS